MRLWNMSEKQKIEAAFCKNPFAPQLPCGLRLIELKTKNRWLMAIVESIRTSKSYEVVWYDFGGDFSDLTVREETIAKYDYLAA